MSNPYLHMFRTANRYARGQRTKHVMISVAFILANGVSMLNPLVYGWFINALQREGTNALRSLWWYVLIHLALSLGYWVLYGPARNAGRYLAFDLSRNYLQALHSRVMQLPVQWHTDHHSGATINRMMKGYEALRIYFENDYLYLRAICNFVFSMIAMIYFSPLYGSLSVVLGVCAIWVIFKFDAAYMNAMKEVNERENNVASTLLDSLANILTVISLRIEKQMEDNALRKVTALFAPFKRRVRINSLKWFTCDLLTSLIYLAIVIGYVYQHYYSGEIFLVGGLVALIVYVNRFTSVFNDLAWLYSMVLQQSANVRHADVILQYVDEDVDEGGAGALTPEPLATQWQTVLLQNIQFAYPAPPGVDKKKLHLQQVTLRIRRGQKIALIGKSGSGKSTLMALLRGLYLKGYNMSIFVDNRSMGQDIRILSNHITFLPQEPEVFEHTVRYNITMGLPFETTAIDAACQLAQVTDMIAQLPYGLDTDLKEKGINLSGGQKQRLALARGILAMAHNDMVMMDEPTSHVDMVTEYKIFHDLLHAMAGKTILTSVHRLHLLEMFDYVYILQDGKITDEGTYAWLKNNSAAFNALQINESEK